MTESGVGDDGRQSMLSALIEKEQSKVVSIQQDYEALKEELVWAYDRIATLEHCTAENSVLK